MAEKAVTVIATTAFKLGGVHQEPGTLLRDVEPDMAKELAGAGRVRLATEADIAAADKAAKAAEAAAKAAAAAAKKDPA